MFLQLSQNRLAASEVGQVGGGVCGGWTAVGQVGGGVCGGWTGDTTHSKLHSVELAQYMRIGTSKGTQNQHYQRYLLLGLVYVHEVYGQTSLICPHPFWVKLQIKRGN